MAPHLMFAIVLASFLAPYVGDVTADEGTGEQLSKGQIDKWSEYYRARAAQYRISRADDKSVLVMNPEPLIRWTNLVVSPDITHGECFVWTHNGRPEAFVSLFSYNKNQQRTVAHAWNTFSRHPLLAEYDGEAFWTPMTSGVEEMKPVPNAPQSADTRAKRMVQMRGIARSFSARSGGTDGDKELALRLLATPVYRYAGESEEAVDGGLFAFVTGTDPEVLLLIEARKVDGVAQWHYLPFRHSHLTLRVRYNDAPVWESLRGETDFSVPARDRLYLSQHGVGVQERMLE